MSYTGRVGRTNIVISFGGKKYSLSFLQRCLCTGDLSGSWVSTSRFFSLPSFQIARITVRMALAIGLAESRIKLLVADATFSFETDSRGGCEDGGSRRNDKGGIIFYLLLVEVICHHSLESLFEVGEFADEVLGEYYILHILELIGETIDYDHGDDVLDGHHACTIKIEDGGESVLLSEESINIVGEGGGHLEFEKLEE